jgi:hypothetical protein
LPTPVERVRARRSEAWKMMFRGLLVELMSVYY